MSRWVDDGQTEQVRATMSVESRKTRGDGHGRACWDGRESGSEGTESNEKGRGHWGEGREGKLA